MMKFQHLMGCLAAALILSSCAAAPPPASPAPTVRLEPIGVGPLATPTPAPSSSSLPTGKVQQPRAVVPDTTRPEVIAAAERFATAFARPQAAAASTWWQQVEPLLTPKARSDYGSVDPTGMWFSKITGPTKILYIPGAPSGNFYACIVATDGGELRIEMIRTPEGLKVAWAGRLS